MCDMYVTVRKSMATRHSDRNNNANKIHNLIHQQQKPRLVICSCASYIGLIEVPQSREQTRYFA